MGVNGMCCRHCEGVDEINRTISDLRVESATTSTGVAAIAASVVRIEDGMVHKGEFRPVRAIAFGLVGAIMIAFIGGLTALMWGARP
jgi:hypothetical protein